MGLEVKYLEDRRISMDDALRVYVFEGALVNLYVQVADLKGFMI